MIWRWLIFSSVGLGLAYGATVTGEIELTNSKNAAVRRHKDYAGVVLWLEPLDRPAPAPQPKHADMKQKDKEFVPHVLAIGLGSTVDSALTVNQSSPGAPGSKRLTIADIACEVADQASDSTGRSSSRESCRFFSTHLLAATGAWSTSGRGPSTRWRRACWSSSALRTSC